MSQLGRIDLSARDRAPGSEKPRRRSLSPLRRNPEYSTGHQYVTTGNDLYTILVYDKDHQGAPYIQWCLLNVPGKEIEKGKELFKLQRLPLDSDHKYNVDIYRQLKGQVRVDVNYSDEKRNRFPIHGFVSLISGELVSRQEFHRSQFEETKVYLT